MKIDIYNTNNKYNIIYADPPWKYGDVHTWHKMGGGVSNHYKCMTITELEKMGYVEVIGKKKCEWTGKMVAVYRRKECLK